MPLTTSAAPNLGVMTSKLWRMTVLKPEVLFWFDVKNFFTEDFHIHSFTEIEKSWWPISTNISTSMSLAGMSIWTKTRWTFFRDKLVFECEFEISWSLGPLDLGTLGPLPSSNTSSYFPLHPLTSSYLFLLLSSFGMVWYEGWGGG